MRVGESLPNGTAGVPEVAVARKRLSATSYGDHPPTGTRDQFSGYVFACSGKELTGQPWCGGTLSRSQPSLSASPSDGSLVLLVAGDFGKGITENLVNCEAFAMC